jgi:hypothetical protein
MFLPKNKLHKFCVEFHSLIQSLDTFSKSAVNAWQFSYQVYKFTLDLETLDSQLLAQSLELSSGNTTCLRVFCLLLVTFLIKRKENNLFLKIVIHLKTVMYRTFLCDSFKFCNFIFLKNPYQARDFRIKVHNVYIYY